MAITDRNREELLARSKFRSRFKLDPGDIVYIERTGLGKIRSHAVDFIRQRLASFEPHRDGKQTPFKGHPVFKAQHATATCCRGCLQKWYDISKGRVLSSQEIEMIVEVIMRWICQNRFFPKGSL